MSDSEIRGTFRNSIFGLISLFRKTEYPSFLNFYFQHFD